MDITPNPPLFPEFSASRGASTDAQDAEGDNGNLAARADFSSFLTLLTAQLRNQDPLQPLDSTQFVAQLASFSTVEQLIGTNDRLDSLISGASSGDVARFASWIGQDVTSVDGTFRARGAEVVFGLPQVPEADRIVAIVRRADGSELRRLDLPANTVAEAVWDGRTAEGALVVDEDMSIELRYLAGEEVVSLRVAEIPRRVTGVRGTADGPVLDLADGGQLRPDAISRISAPAIDPGSD